MRPSSSSGRRSNNFNDNHQPSKNNNKNKQSSSSQKRSAPSNATKTTKSSSSLSSEELAIKAFLHHEQDYEKESKIRKINNNSTGATTKRRPTVASSSSTSSTPSSSSFGMKEEEEELERLSNNMLQQTNKTAIDCGEDLDKLGDLETVVCYLKKRIPTTTFTIPSSMLPPNHCNFSILDHLKFLLPTIKKEIQFHKQQALKKTHVKQPSTKTKMAITTGKEMLEMQTSRGSSSGCNNSFKSDKLKVQKLKHTLNEILKNRETRLGIFGIIPYEVLLQVFSFLNWKMLHMTINRVCREWNDSVLRYEHCIISSWHHLDVFSAYCEEHKVVEPIEIQTTTTTDESDEDEDTADVREMLVKRTHLLTSIVEKALLDYCNLNYHIIQPLIVEESKERNTSGEITKEILTEKVLDYIVPQVFPNVKYLTGKGLDDRLINIFHNHVKYIDIDYAIKKYDDNSSSKSPGFRTFPNIEYLQWCAQRFWMTDANTECLQPLFENVKHLVLKFSIYTSVLPTFFSTVFRKGYRLQTVNVNALDGTRFQDFCRAIEPHMKNIDPNNEVEGLRKIELTDCTLNSASVQLLGSVAGHLLKVLHLGRIDSLDDCFKNYKRLEELSITNSKLKPSFVDHLTSCPFGPSLKILNLRGSNFNFSSIQPSSFSNMHLTGEIISSMTNNQPINKEAAQKERVIEFKKDLVKILNWMIPPNATMQMLNAIELKLVLTDYGEFYFQRTNKRNQPNRFVWRNRLPNNETVTVVRNKNGTCYWDKLF